jgi:hypothetical protein
MSKGHCASHSLLPTPPYPEPISPMGHFIGSLVFQLPGDLENGRLWQGQWEAQEERKVRASFLTTVCLFDQNSTCQTTCHYVQLSTGSGT